MWGASDRDADRRLAGGGWIGIAGAPKCGDIDQPVWLASGRDTDRGGRDVGSIDVGGRHCLGLPWQDSDRKGGLLQLATVIGGRRVSDGILVVDKVGCFRSIFEWCGVLVIL